MVAKKTGTIDLVHILATQGQAGVIAAVLGTLPFKIIVFAVYCLSCFIFFGHHNLLIGFYCVVIYESETR